MRESVRAGVVVMLVLLGLVPAAHASSSSLVISQVYTHGGEPGATYCRDYVEVFNRGAATVNAGGLIVQFASAAGSTWTPYTLDSVVLEPGDRTFVEFVENSMPAEGCAVPPPGGQYAGLGPTLDTSAGKVALAETVLTCGGIANRCPAGSFIDLVGYGAASDYEGAPGAAPGPTQALVRAVGGCTDSDSNTSDLVLGSPLPRNHLATPSPCGSGEAPVAAADSYAATEDTELEVAAPGLLENDSDAEGDPFTAELVSQPPRGHVTIEPDGSFAYLADPDYNGTDSFSYRVRNPSGVTSAAATVSLTVAPVNDAPVAENDNAEVPEGEASSISSVLDNDFGANPDNIPPQAEELSAELVSGPAHGTLDLNADGTYTYEPDPGWIGLDSFTYRAYDGEFHSNVGTVSLVVYDVPYAPVGVPDSATTPEDTPITASTHPSVLSNDTDADHYDSPSTLGLELVSGPSHGELSFSPHGHMEYVPEPDYNGPDSFTYKAIDSTNLRSEATIVSITVTPVNDAPEATGHSYTTAEDAALTVAAPGVLEGDSDIDGDSLSAQIESEPAHGELSLGPDGGFVYSPDPDYNGADSFVYRASDGAAHDTATVTLTVTPVDEPPSGDEAEPAGGESDNGGGGETGDGGVPADANPPLPQTAPPSDDVAPVPSVAGARRQRLAGGRTLVLRLGCDEACDALVKGRLSVPGAARLYRLRTVTRSLAAGERTRLRVKLPKRARRAAKAALRRGRKVKATLTVTVRDAGGNAASATRRIKLKR